MPPETQVDFEMPLISWRRHYVILLKLAALELESGTSPLRRATTLLRWLHTDFLFKAPSVVLALHYLAPKARRRGLLKGLRSPDRDRAVAGIRNAAWDLTLLSEWLKRAGAEKQATLLATSDRWVRTLAQTVGSTEAAETDEEHLRCQLRAFWKPSDLDQISTLFLGLGASLDDPTRAQNRGPLPVDRLIRDGEEWVRGWRPRDPARLT